MITRRSLLLAGAALAACGDGGDPPEVESVQVNDHGPIFRSLTIRLAAPADLVVEYGTPAGQRLRIASSASASAVHEVVLPRLKASRSYDFRILVSPRSNGQWSARGGTFATGSLPAELALISFTASGQPTEPLLFLSMRSRFTGGVIVDALGDVVWYGSAATAPQGATRRGNGNWVLVTGFGLEEFDALGRVVRSLAHSRLPGPVTSIHHGVTETPDGQLLFIALDPLAVGTATLYGEALWRWAGDGSTPTKLWSAFDFMDPLGLDRSDRSIPTDWLHANAVSFGATGNILVSFHFLDQIISIAPDFRTVQWRLGGLRSTFAQAPDQVFSGQHSPREVSPGNLLLFDNGFARTDGSRYSRLVEFELNPALGTVRTAWQYRPSPAIWSTVISSARRLPNGKTAGTFGTPAGVLGATGPVAMHEVTSAGQLLATLRVDGPGVTSVFQGDPISSIAGESVVG